MSIAPGDFATAQSVNDGLLSRLLRDANLGDLPNVGIARTNLRLRDMALQDPAAVAIAGGTLDNVAIGGTAAAYGKFATLIVEEAGTFTAPPTGAFWSDDGATVLRMNDRLLVGGAAANDAAKPNVTTDWLSALINWPVFNATAAITSSFGTIALTVGSQTSDLDAAAAGSTETTIGLAAFAIANNPGTYPTGYFSAYGFYGEARVYPGTVSTAFGAELEAINLSGSPNASPTPYRELQTGSAQSLRLGSGGGQGLSPYPAISALAIVPNGSTFNTGIVFDKGAITGADGTSGFGEAIAMAHGHLVSWYAAGMNSTGVRTMFITSTIADDANKVSIQAQDGGLLFIGPNDTVGFSIATIHNSVNGLGIKPSVAGHAAELEAFGADAVVDVKLVPKGVAGTVMLAIPAAAAALAGSAGALPSLPAKYLVVRDAGGTLVGVPAYNLP